MNKGFCYLWHGIRLFYLPATGLIHAVKCSIVGDALKESIKTWTIEEFKNVPDIYEELNSIVNKWPKCHTRELRPFGCNPDVEECFCDNCELKHIEVAFQSECNLRCRFCAAQGNRVGIAQNGVNKELHDLYWKTLYCVRDKHLDYIRLTDFGEPLLYMNEVKKYLKMITLRDTKMVVVTTNASLMDDEFIRLCRKSDFIIYPIISLNAYSKEHYIQKMGYDYFDTVMGNIKKLRERNLPFKVNFVVDETSDEEQKNYLPIAQQFFDWGIKFSFFPENSVVDKVMECETFNKLVAMSADSFGTYEKRVKDGDFDKHKVSILKDNLLCAMN